MAERTARRVILGRLVPETHKYFLRRFLGFVHAEHVSRHSIDRLGITVINEPERRHIPSGDASREQFVAWLCHEVGWLGWKDGRHRLYRAGLGGGRRRRIERTRKRR